MSALSIPSLMAALQLMASAADGQRYGRHPLGHAMSKGAVSVATYGAVRGLGGSRLVATTVATVGVVAVAKGLELAKGHTLGPLDTVHDVVWHTSPVLVLALRRPTNRLALVAGLVVVVATCSRASPRWC